MSYEPEPEGYGEEGYGPGARPEVARRKVGTPAILLIIVGVFNILLALAMLGIGVQWTVKSVDQIRAEQQQAAELVHQFAPNLPQEEMQKQTPEQLKMQNMITYLASGAISLVSGLLTLFGGVRMRGLQSYGLAVLGSVLALLPCTSPCCILGQVAGIWGLVVLMSQDVKSAFR